MIAMKLDVRPLLALLEVHVLDLLSTALGLQVGFVESNSLGATLLSMGWPMVVAVDGALVFLTWFGLSLLHPRVRRIALPAAVGLFLIPAILNIAFIV
jgi:hypothetical protein